MSASCKLDHKLLLVANALCLQFDLVGFISSEVCSATIQSFSMTVSMGVCISTASTLVVYILIRSTVAFAKTADTGKVVFS